MATALVLSLSRRKIHAMNRWIRRMIAPLLGLLCWLSAAQALQVGEMAPEFSLPATVGEKISLAEYRGKQPVVLFFYIAAFGRS